MINGGGHDAPFGDFEPDGTPYTRYREEQEEREREAVRSAQHDALVRCLTADEFFAKETAANLVVPALGICPGPPTGLVGQAYVGKTIMALSMGLSVATGKDLWGLWSVQSGVWLHLDYEQGRRHTKSRAHRLARGLGVTDEHLRALLLAEQVRLAILPGLRLSTPRALDHFCQLFDGVRLVTCDSLRPMLGGVDENSSQVRALMNVLSTASDKTGAAVVQLHHAGKTPNDGSQRTRKEQSRGSSGIIDEFQSMFVLTKKKGEAFALVTHEKDRELGDTVADFGLSIEDVAGGSDGQDPKWGLRVVHVDREQFKESDSSKAKFTKVVQAVRDCIRDNPGIAGSEAVAAMIGGTAVGIRAAVNTLLAEGEIVEHKGSGKGRGRRFYLSHMAPPDVC